MIVSRPAVDDRVELKDAELDPVDGLVGDSWRERGSKYTSDGTAHPDMQIAIMNSRVIQLLAHERSRWSLAGDQLFVDLDLSPDNLPSGQLLAIGDTVLEVTDYAHNGCGKFSERFGPAAIRFVNSEEGRAERRRGLYARVVRGGAIRVGDTLSKIESLNDTK